MVFNVFCSADVKSPQADKMQANKIQAGKNKFFMAAFIFFTAASNRRFLISSNRRFFILGIDNYATL